MDMESNVDISAPKVSVVVPIYKVERYLRQCVDSILAQTLHEIEVILVDDGSPDGCPAIVDEYAAKDCRVVAVHQPNGGYGKAVNHGISLASAPYIGIIESDDWIEPTMYEKLYKRAEETGAELVKCMFWKYDSTVEPAQQNKLYLGRIADLKEAPDAPFQPLAWLPIFAFHASLWSNLYRTEFLRQIPIIETAGAGYQDLPFIMEVLARAQKMSVVKEPLLHYRVEEGQGSSTTCHDERLLRMPDMCLRARKMLEKLGVLSVVKEAFYLQVFLANASFQRSIREDLQQCYFDAYHQVMAPIVSDRDFHFIYFSRKEKCRARIIASGGSVRNLKKRWGIVRRLGGIIIRLNGRDFDI